MFDRYEWANKGWFQKLAKKGKLNFTWRIPAESGTATGRVVVISVWVRKQAALPELHAELLRATNTDRQTIIFCLSEVGPVPESIPYMVKSLSTHHEGGLCRAAQPYPHSWERWHERSANGDAARDWVVE
jgi:hypothetical protein